MTAIELVRLFEGLKTTAYKGIDGLWTCGYGHTGRDVFPGLMWSIAQCEDHLANDLADANTLLKTYSPGPFAIGAEDALTDFVFNLGIGNYRTSTLRRYVDAEAWANVKIALLDWDHCCGIVVPGLLRRRQAEADNIIMVAA